MIGKLQYLKVGLGLVLAFVGAKMLLAGVYKVPGLVSLTVIVVLLGGSMVASLLYRPVRPRDPSVI